MEVILETKKISKTYSGICVLNKVNFDLCAGEVHALVGENGAGKSTFIKIIAGIIAPDEGGEMYFAGERIHHITAARSRQLGISVIYQDISLFPNLSIAENICFGSKMHGFQRWKDIYSLAQSTIDKMGIKLDLHSLVEETSISQQQLIAIARAITFNAKVIIMDEPTASLSSSEVEMLYTIIRNLKEQGIGIIYISHKLDEIFALADRVSILRDGSLVACDTIDKLNQPRLISLMVGRELHFVPYHNEGDAGGVLFEVKGLTCKPYFRNVSFRVRRNEILGVAGLVGAGRSEVAKCIFGLLKQQAGEIFLHGEKIDAKDVAQAIKKGISYIPEDRFKQGLFMLRSMYVNVTAANMKKVLNKVHLFSRKKEIKVTNHYIDRLSIQPNLPELNVINLSGGNQQKVLVSRWLNTNPKLLIADEVTSGVDVRVKSEIHKLLRKLASSGIAVVMISSDLPEILALSDRIMVMREGDVVDFMDVTNATQETIFRKAILN